MYVCVNETSYVFCFDAQANEIKDKDSESSLLDDANRSQQKRRVLSCAHADTHTHTHTLSPSPFLSHADHARMLPIGTDDLSLSLILSLSLSLSLSCLYARVLSVSLKDARLPANVRLYKHVCIH